MGYNLNTAGLGLAIICFLIIVIQVATNKWTRRWKNYYFYWAGIALFALIWVMIFKFLPNLANYNQRMASGSLNPSYQGDAWIVSSRFVLDACPASVIVMCLALIFDPTRKIARSYAPVAMLGGIMITFFQMPFWNEPEWTLRFIFIGTDANPCYFFFHAFNLLISVGVMLNTPKYEWKGYLACVASYGIYYSYVAATAAITGCKWFVSGLNLNDWTSAGQYHIIAEVLNISPKVAMPLGLVGLPLIASVIIVLNDYVFKRWIWKYGNTYSHVWYKWYNYNSYTKLKFI